MRKFFIGSLFVCVMGLLSCAEAAPNPKGVKNEGIYPPADSAKSFIDFDNKGFIVDGKRVYLASGSIHYARLPHEQWADRLLRLKQASFNDVQTYSFWNYHEPVEGQWNFAGDGDVEGFLETAQKVGLYATVRVGPYVCAEWDSGGYPIWLRFVQNLKAVRTSDPVWLSLNDHWYDKIIPIIAKHQINRGGNVILVQLENEHPKGWGIQENPYFVHLHDVAVKDGVEVPHFMSGLNHGGNPSPGNLDPAKRATPWYTTEFWAGWFDDYRTINIKKFRQIVAANWAIMAHGGAGQNYYMAYGGSNFDSWSDDSTGASYDYGAAIGQAGDLRPIYYQMKRANQLAASFPGIISNSTDARESYSDFVAGKGVAVSGVRASAAGTIVFLSNPSGADAVAMLKSGETLRMPAHSDYPLPQNAVIADGVKIVDSTVPVLGVAKNDHVVTIIVYGRSGESGRLTLSATDITAGKKSPAFTADLANPEHLNLKIKLPHAGVEECDLNQSDLQIRVLAIDQDLSLYTWIIGPAERQNVVFGPDYVQSASESVDGKMTATIERPYGQPSCGQVAIYGAKDKSWHLGAAADASIESQPAPSLGNWQMSAVAQEQPNFDDSNWKQSDQPLEMGADGDYSAFAWYRSTVTVPSAGSGTLSIKGGDNLELFINGEHVDGKRGTWQANFVVGKNSVAVFASHKGRPKFYNYLGALNVAAADPKGIVGKVTLAMGGQTMEITGWKLKGGPGGDVSKLNSLVSMANTHGVPAFYQATFNDKPPGELGAHPILRVNYKGLSRGMIWVNGHSLGRYPEKIRIDSLYIPEPWLKDGENVLTVFDETGASPNQIGLLVEQPASREVIRASEAVDAATPIVVPAEDKPVDFKAMNKGNLAFNRSAAGSYTPRSGGQDIVGQDAVSATDGDVETSWGPPSPRNVSSAAVKVDFGKPQAIKVCEILFDSAANGYKYSVEGSADGTTWTTLGDQSTAVPTSPDSPSELARLNVTGDAVRYLRVTIHGGRNFSIAEVRAFGDAK